MKPRATGFQHDTYQAAGHGWFHFAIPTAAASALFVTAALSFALNDPPSAPQAEGDYLAANIDPAVSPREDFFHYADGGWLKRNPIPEDRAQWGIWNVESDEVASQLRVISEHASTKRAGRGSPEQLIGDVWFTGMDSATINKQALAPLQPDLDQIDQIRSIGDLIDVVATLHRRNMLTDDWFTRQRVLFGDDVEQDESNSSRWTYSLSQAGITMGRLGYSDPSRVKIQNALHEYLFKTFLRIEGDSGKAKTSADAVYDLEARLAKGFQQDGESSAMRLTDLRQLAPIIDWNRYFRRLGVANIDSVVVRQPGFFQALDSALKVTPLANWRDYLKFWLIKVNAPFLDDGTFGEFFAYKSAITGQLQQPPRWRRVVWQEEVWFGLPLTKLFVEMGDSKNASPRYQAIAESFREAFRDRIEHLDWMSNATKQNALLKLDHLKITIGYRESSIDFRTMPLQRDSYVLNMIRSAEWFHDQEIKRLNTPVDKDKVDLHPGIDDDAEYLRSNNEVRIQTPVIAPGVRDQELDDAFVYGSTPLGHEISHAFDSEGRHYDADGNKSDWWTEQDAAAFDQRTQALIDEFSEFTPLEGQHIDGRRSLPENMADLVGLRIALDAFKKTKQFRENKRLGGFTPLQRFFLAYAYGHMGHQTRASLAASLRIGSYSPDRERVNGAVMNIPEFCDAFDVRPGDPMYRPESVRARLW